VVENSNEERVLDLLGDHTTREILTAAYPGPVSAHVIAEHCGVAPSTVYRHVDDLRDANLLVERTKIERDGSHHSLYETNLDHVGVDLDPGGFAVSVQVSRPPPERFVRMWSDIRRT